ncbi:MAG: hypothetical protein RDU20_23315 [Desulfomonilaceae bacterium]|nr:hypothetical protein [Desulfomonilaceae bacterium]
MKIFDLAELADSSGGEYVLGAKDLHTDSCYMIYGVLAPGEADRLVRAGKGHEEILCSLTGTIMLHTTAGEVPLHRGSAVLVKEDDSFYLSNPSDRALVYVTAGGRCRPERDRGEWYPDGKK